ncbi:galectin-related protein 1.2 [Biomphalaria pfeifferi]|uniref:Galectin n=1 Tax=Biomphalaria pfeifferi TaxID=112525 RepID=A0AAD8FIJ9_BIOPF|nr:galectin-related protein 1.2 [Biomphalaria pfeifferi]
MAAHSLYIAVFVSILAFCSDIAECQITGILTADFKPYPNVSTLGQMISQGSNFSKLWCAFLCLSSPECTGFRYQQSCEIVDNNVNTSVLNFSTGDDVLRKRKVFLRELSYNSVNLTSYQLSEIPSRVVLGDMVYLKAKLLKHSDVRVTLFEQLDQSNITYEFRARCSTSACKTKYVTISNKMNGVWNTTIYSNTPAYTLSVNETFEYHMLVTSHGLVTFLKNVFVYTLSTQMSFANANYIIISGSIAVEEFSM